MIHKSTTDRPGGGIAEPGPKAVVAALGLALAGVILTRWPVARPAAYDSDEIGFLRTISVESFPMFHTLFLVLGRWLGQQVGDAYRGFVVLDMLVSAGALTAVWWWLRALVRPATAAAASLVLAAAPLFWTYGAMAGNYTAIPLVGSILLGIAVRGRSAPRTWHPFAAAVVLAFGAGYRQDIGTFWLPVFLVILWQHRWLASTQAGLLFVALNLAWFIPMLRDAGGWELYRARSSQFGYTNGYLNSVWNLGPIDASLRYVVKAVMALTWTLGPGLLVTPRGLIRLGRTPGGGFLAALLALSIAPALGSHLLVHFGVPGYAFHYLPALLALLALGIGRNPAGEQGTALDRLAERPDRAPARLVGLAVVLAAVFLIWPIEYRRPGLARDFSLALARYSRDGLRTHPPLADPQAWRTINSQELPGGHRASEVRRSVVDLFR